MIGILGLRMTYAKLPKLMIDETLPEPCQLLMASITGCKIGRNLKTLCSIDKHELFPGVKFGKQR